MPVPLIIAGLAAAAAAGTASVVNSNNQLSSAEGARQQALQAYLNVHVPDPGQQAVILQKYQQTGQLDPQILQALQQTSNAWNGVTLNQTSEAAQLQALAQLQNIVQSGGLDAEAKAQIQQAINQTESTNQGNQAAILQSAERRGVAGSGTALQAQLLAGQNAAQNLSSDAMSAQSEGEQRALQALSQLGSQAGTLTGQQLQLDSARAQAQNAINQFNVQNAQQVAATNVAALNDAQKYNLGVSQNIANMNTNVTNQQALYNAGLLQQQFQDEMALASGQANAAGGVANTDLAGAQMQGDLWGGIASALAQGAGTVYKGMGSSSSPASAGGTPTADFGQITPYTMSDNADAVPSGVSTTA